MSEYKGIKGFSIQSLSADPADPNIGQVWYNSTSGSWKVTSAYNSRFLGNWWKFEYCKRCFRWSRNSNSCFSVMVVLVLDLQEQPKNIMELLGQILIL
jgi:hypothetical protein